jgi:general secretion pathway protein J
LSTIWQNKGFTLLELLIALTLLVLLSGTLYGTWFTVIKGRDSASARMENLREVRTTLDMLRRELASAFYNKDNKRLHFIVEDRDSFASRPHHLILQLSPPRLRERRLIPILRPSVTVRLKIMERSS